MHFNAFMPHACREWGPRHFDLPDSTSGLWCLAPQTSPALIFEEVLPAVCVLGLLMENGKETRKKQWDRAKASTLFLRVLKRNMCKRLPFQMYLLIGDIIFNDATWLTNTVSSLGLICSQGLCNDVLLNDGPHIRQWSHTVIRKLKPSHHLVTPKHPAFPTCVCCAGVSKPALLPGV